MAKHIELEFTKTYASEDNAHKAVAKMYGDANDIRYMVVPTQTTKFPGQWRYGVVFIANNAALIRGVHFNFNVVN